MSCPRFKNFWPAVSLALLLWVSPLMGETLGDWRIAGKNYKNLEVIRQSEAMVTLRHKDGIVSFYVSELPKDLQKKLGYELEEVLEDVAKAQKEASHRRMQVRQTQRKEIAENREFELERYKVELDSQKAPPQVDEYGLYHEKGGIRMYDLDGDRYNAYATFKNLSPREVYLEIGDLEVFFWGGKKTVINRAYRLYPTGDEESINLYKGGAAILMHPGEVQKYRFFFRNRYKKEFKDIRFKEEY